MKTQEKLYQLSQNRNQNYWELASIQSASLGLGVIIIGEQIAEKYGSGVAICSILVGNLILWLVGVVIISMANRDRINAIQNVKGYIGRGGASLVALILIFAFLNWYTLQINSTTVMLDTIIDLNSKEQANFTIRIGAFFGLLSALLAIGGIRLIKLLSLIFLPILFFLNIYIIITSDVSNAINEKWGLSFYAIISTVLIELPGMVNLPTFFRHSRSRADSYLALTIMTFFISFFEISTIWIRLSNFTNAVLFSQHQYSFIFHLLPLISFIIIMLILTNLLNIYFASACWETFIPRFGGPKEYAIIGLFGTAAYTFFQISPPMLFLLDLTNDYIANLGATLLMAFLIRIVVKHRPRTFERIINFISWIVGSIAATVLEIKYPQQGIQTLLAGIGCSILFFLCVIFIEETIWATKKLDMIKKKL